MKKAVSLLLCAAMFTSIVMPAFAADSDGMKASLLSVKQRIEIPERFEEFNPSIDDDRDGVTYTFGWTDPESRDSLYVRADEEGRISDYRLYLDNQSGFGIADLTPDEARRMADATLKKAAPELFADENDCLVFDEAQSYASSYNGRTRCDLVYLRIANGVEVLDNNASVEVVGTGSDAYVRGFGISWDYDAKFKDENAELQNPEESFFEAFPTELYYKRSYRAPEEPKMLSDGSTLCGEAKLVYTFANGTGYISADSGEKVLPKDNDVPKLSQSAASKDEAADFGLSQNELDELTRVEGLITPERAETIVRSVHALKLSDALELTSSDVYRQNPWYAEGGDGKYIMRITLSSDDGWLFASLDAKSGEILSLSSQCEQGKTDIDELIREVYPEKVKECVPQKEREQGDYIFGTYRRTVNGVPYNGNGIGYTYNKEKGTVTGFYLDWDDTTEFFPAKENAISLAEAQDKIMSIAPLKLIWVDDGEGFRLCYTLSIADGYTELDAESGEPINTPQKSGFANVSFTDIGGHWAEKAIRRLTELGLCKNEEQFRPDDKITQEELLSMLERAFNNIDADGDWLYEILTENGTLSPSEKNPSSEVAREDAFVFTVRFTGFERVARLGGIYKCDYIDKELISADKIGYAAILTGFGVISGDAEGIRAKDSLTRAEAAMMIYRYMTYRE